MENREFLEQIQQYAVRIGNAGDKELYGSGTLFLMIQFLIREICLK